MMETVGVCIDSRTCGDFGGHQFQTLETLQVHPSLVPSIGDQILVDGRSFVVVARRFMTGSFTTDMTTFGKTTVTHVYLVVERCVGLYATEEPEVVTEEEEGK